MQQSIKHAQSRLIPYEKERFDPSDYPNYVSLEEQIKVLESLGSEGAQQVAVSIQEWMDEYHMQAQIEGEPYYWLLMELGMPFYNEEGVILNYPTEVFSFDFEGYDISTDYIEILNGMLALAKGSCLDSVSNIREDITKVNWEQGDGKITLYLEWNGQEYAWDMDVYYDWIDSKVIGVLNVLLLEEGTQKLFYMTGDNGQGAIIFFCTPEWAEAFSEKTSLKLWHYEAWTDAQKEYVKIH